MTNHSALDFERLRQFGTNGINYDLDTEAIIHQLQAWRSQCEFTLGEVSNDTVELLFTTLPENLDQFVQELYEFCPDLVEQGTECIVDLIPEMAEISPELQALIAGIDLSQETAGLEILKRQIQQTQSVLFWWD